MKIFSYGSNMLTARIKDRIESYQFYSTGYVKGYSLKFHKLSKDTSGKASIFYTGNQEDLVWGVIGEINDEDKSNLDKYEGLGKGYNEKSITVVLKNNSTMEATVYVADEEFIDDKLLPFDWYKDFVLNGAIENSLPKDYIENIRLVDFRIDDNKERREKNYKIMNEAGTQHRL